MPVNEHDNPYVVPHQQTYVSQHVQLPFAELQGYADKRQATFDQAELAEEAIHSRLLQAQALQKDKKLRNDIIANYENEMVKNIEATGGDYALAIPKIKQQGRQLHEDFTRGRLGAITGNFNSAQAYSKGLQEKYDKGDITLDQYNGLQAISMSNYKGVQEAIQPGSNYNSYNGITEANKVDVDAKVEDLIDGYMADKSDSGQWSQTPDGRYRYHTKSGWKTVRADDVYRDVAKALEGDKDVMNFLSQTTQIEGFNAQQQGLDFDFSSSLNSKLNQYSRRAASKAGFKESYHDQDKFKADEYALDRFKQNLKFELENIEDSITYQSSALEQKNPLTTAKGFSGESLTGQEGLKKNVRDWNQQGAQALKGFVDDLEEQSKGLSGEQFAEADAAVKNLKSILAKPNGYIELIKCYVLLKEGELIF